MLLLLFLLLWLVLAFLAFGCGLCGQCGQPLVTGCGLVMLFAPAPQLRDGDAVQLQPSVPELRHPGHLQELQGRGSLIPPTRAAGSLSLPPAPLLLTSSPVNPGDPCHGGGHPGVAQEVQRRAVRGCRCHDHGAGHGACNCSRQRRSVRAHCCHRTPGARTTRRMDAVCVGGDGGALVSSRSSARGPCTANANAV